MGEWDFSTLSEHHQFSSIPRFRRLQKLKLRVHEEDNSDIGTRKIGKSTTMSNGQSPRNLKQVSGFWDVLNPRCSQIHHPKPYLPQDSTFPSPAYSTAFPSTINSSIQPIIILHPQYQPNSHISTPTFPVHIPDTPNRPLPSSVPTHFLKYSNLYPLKLQITTYLLHFVSASFSRSPLARSK